VRALGKIENEIRAATRQVTTTVEYESFINIDPHEMIVEHSANTLKVKANNPSRLVGFPLTIVVKI
jgi:hypothetical protein